jgi:hypothetical protein
MALQSEILSGNSRLDQAAAGNAVIRAAPPHDDADAVRRIQKGLVAILRIQMPLSFPNGPNGEPDGKFGNETFQAVIDFQKMAFPNDSRQWDGRVGRLTLGEMDSRLPARGRAAPAPTPPTPPGDLVLDILLAGTTPPHNLSKSDLESTMNVNSLTTRQRASLLVPLPIHPGAPNPVPPPFNLTPVPLINHTTRSLELYFQQEALVASLASAGGRRLISDFFANTTAKAEILYADGSVVSILVRDNASFSTNAGAFEADFTRRMRLVLDASGGTVNPATLKADLEAHGGPMTPPGLPFFGLGSELGILGSFQESRVRLVGLKIVSGREFTAKLQYEVFDHFGCDDTDLEGLPSHGTPGQIAMWLLARDPSHAPGHKPFVVRIHVLRSVADTRP